MAGKVTNPSRVPKNAVLLSKVASLTLRNGKLTSSRRVDAAPQLECVGPAEVCKLYKVDVMRCVNEGADYDADNIQWSCKASLPEDFKLGSTDVICEGYESSDDPYVLKGSCGVEYRLILTDKGEEKYGSIASPITIDFKPGSGSGTVPTLFVIVFVVVLFIILKGMWSRWNENPPRPGRPRPADWNNNNNDDDDDPPPPYDGPPPYLSRPPKPQTKTTAPRTSTSTRASSSRSAAQNGTQQAWRPGFWTGTAAGAAAGYYAGNRGRTQQGTATQEAPRQQETQQRPGGLFNTFFNPQQRTQAPQAPASPSSSNSSPSYSTTRHESTGFGSTRRR